MNHPFRFCLETLQSDTPLPIANEPEDIRDESLDRLTGIGTPLFLSAVDSIDGAITLLASCRISQAVVLLAQALEVSLKGVLDEKEQLGLGAWMARRPQFARNLADINHSEQRIRETLKGRSIKPVFDEVRALLGLSSESDEAFDQINRRRNEILHGGGNAEREHDYLWDIVASALPILDEIYTKYFDVSLADLIHHDIARELIVAGRYLHRHRSDMYAWDTALKPLAAAYTHRYPRHAGPSPADLDAFEFFEDIPPYEELVDSWLEDRWLECGNPNCLSEACRICGKHCIVEVAWELKCEDGTLYYSPTTVVCFHCHLTIGPDDKDLAEIHFGRIDQSSSNIDWERTVEAIQQAIERLREPTQQQQDA